MLTNKTRPIGAGRGAATALVASCASVRRGGYVVARGRACLSSLPTYPGGESGHKLAGMINDPRFLNGRNRN
jgi:hypothetical protein